jgi:rubrerythrin
MNQAQLKELLIQSLEHERGGIKLYEAAVRCAQNEDLKEEFEKYHEQTKNHERILLNVFKQFELDPEENSPGRRIVKANGAALLEAIEMAEKSGDAAAAQIVACEVIVLAETKDHADWELLSKCAEKATGKTRNVLKPAVEEVEEQEDEHLYHSKGWCRELWLQSLGLKAVLPPPEERRHVTSAIGAARAEQESERSR